MNNHSTNYPITYLWRQSHLRNSLVAVEIELEMRGLSEYRISPRENLQRQYEWDNIKKVSSALNFLEKKI